MQDSSEIRGQSGQLFGLEQYTKETLIELLKVYSKLYISVDGFWYLSIKEEYGNEKALEYDIRVWDKMYRREYEGIATTLGIRERDVSSFLKIFLLTPWFHQVDYAVEIKSNNHAILTINRCPTLAALEKEGEGREKEICTIVDVDYFEKFAKLFDSNMEFSPIKLPPRKRKEGFCCQWRLKLQ